MHKQMAQLLESSGGKVIGSSVFPANTTDYSSYLLKAKSSGADVVALLNSGQDLKSSLKQAQEFGIDRKQTLVGMSVEITDVDALGLETAQNLAFTSAFYWAQSEATKEWSKKFHERTGKMPTSVQAAVYSAVRHYLQAVKDSNSKDAQTVLAKMRATPVNDIYTTNGHIRPDGAFVHDVFLTRVKKPSESTGRWDYLEILDKIPGEKAYPPADRCKHSKM
jgi:branched-chain amino acid transport system substrate-binding protein